MNVSEGNGIWSPYYNPKMGHLNIFSQEMGFDQLKIQDVLGRAEVNLAQIVVNFFRLLLQFIRVSFVLLPSNLPLGLRA